MPFHKKISNLKSQISSFEFIQDDPEFTEGANLKSPRNWKSPIGFTLIELLVVIAILGIIGSFGTVSFLSYERSARLKNAAMTLKNDLRYAQNKASSGDKGANVSPPNGCLQTPNILVGWYVNLSSDVASDKNKSYKIAGDCLRSDLITEDDFGPKTIKLPKGVSISKLTIAGLRSEVNILFRPLVNSVNTYETVDFIDNTTGYLRTPISTADDLVIELSETGVSNTATVTIKPNGDIYESF